MGRPGAVKIFGAIFAAAFVALTIAYRGADVEAAQLGEEAVAARKDAEQILSKPIFKRAKESQPLLERLGKYLMGLARRLFDTCQRALGTRYATLLSYFVSGAVILIAIGALLWFIIKTPRAPPGEKPLPQSPGAGGQERPALFPLSNIEKAVAAGDLRLAAGMLADWFIASAYDPSDAPWWMTNRELLPELRRLKPLGPSEWDSLVSFHESLRYAHSPPDGDLVIKWLDRAKGFAT